MRGILCFVAALALVATSLADGWLLKTPYEAKTKFTWKVTVNASVGGQDVEATMKQILTVDSKGEKEVKGKTTWSDILVNGSPAGEGDSSWDTTFGLDGSITSAGDNADFARMLTPAAFIYPGKEIKTGDKWSAKFKPAKDAKEMTADYEALEESKVGDTPAIKVRAKLSEDGPMKADNVYWIGKDGSVLKYELDIKNWVVPMAGTGDFDAKVKGELVKS